jgi:hypothetical protein
MMDNYEWSMGSFTRESEKKLTDYWSSHEIKKGQEFAILTNLIHQEWTGVGQ